MKLRREHGMLVLSLIGATALLALFAGGAVGEAGPTPSRAVGIARERGDWEGVEYPALDKLIRQRAAAARAQTARLQSTASTLAHNGR